MNPQHKRLNWKVAAAGGALAGLVVSGTAFADGGGPDLPVVNDVQLVPVDSLASPGSEVVTTTIAPAPALRDTSNIVSVTTPTPAPAPSVVDTSNTVSVPTPAPDPAAPVPVPVAPAPAPIDTSNTVSASVPPPAADLAPAPAPAPAPDSVSVGSVGSVGSMGSVSVGSVD
ncbi:MAG: hypothetical protein AB7Q42_04690 [Acidimicrobiia bacterium]